jgi:hypothetical protein
MVDFPVADDMHAGQQDPAEAAAAEAVAQSQTSVPAPAPPVALSDPSRPALSTEDRLRLAAQQVLGKGIQSTPTSLTGALIKSAADETAVQGSRPATETAQRGAGYDEVVSPGFGRGGMVSPAGTIAQPFGTFLDRSQQKGLENLLKLETMGHQAAEADINLAATETEANRKIGEAVNQAYTGFIEQDQAMAAQEAAADQALRDKVNEAKAKYEDLDKKYNAEYSRPDKFFDARSNNGQTGILGFLSRITWALASDDYQKNTIAATNSLIEQDYRNKMARREALQGQRGLIKDSLAAFERGTQDEHQAAAAWRNAATKRVAMTIEAMAAKAKDPVLRDRYMAMAQHLQVSQYEKDLEMYKNTFKPAQVVGGGGARRFEFDKSGRPTMFVEKLPNGQEYKVSAYNDDDVVPIVYRGQNLGILVGKENKDYKDVAQAARSLQKIESLTERVDRFADDLAKAKNDSERKALVDANKPIFLSLTGEYASSGGAGVMNNAEFPRYNALSGDVSQRLTMAGNIMSTFKDINEHQAKNLSGIVKDAVAANRRFTEAGYEALTSNRTLASRKVIPVGPNTAQVGWTATQFQK